MTVPLKRRDFVCAVAAMFAGACAPRLLAASATGKVPMPSIERQQVDSTSIESIGFNARLKMLEVRFRSGATYRYLDVPPSVFAAFMKAESKGRFFTQQIRGRYEFKRLEKETR